MILYRITDIFVSAMNRREMKVGPKSGAERNI